MTTINPVMQSLPAIVRNDVEKFVSKADAMAHEIIAKNTSTTYEGPVVMRHYHYYNSPFWWYHPVFIYTPYRPCHSGRRGHAKDDGAAILIGATAAIVGGAALYAVGSSINRIQDAKTELRETRAVINKVARHFLARNEEDIAVHASIEKMAKLKERICNRVLNSAAWDLALRVALFVGCGSALFGAIAGAPALISAGAIGSLVVGGGMLFKWGLDSSDRKNYRDAVALRTLIHG